MSDPTLASLARWAVALDADALPEPVAARMRLRQLSVAGAVLQSAALPGPSAVLASGPSRGSCALLGSDRTQPRREAVRFHVTAAEATDFDDLAWMGPAGSGAVAAAWAMAKDATLGELLAACAVGAELASRLGAACALSPRQGQAQGAVQALATAAAYARLLGLSAEQTAHAYALALSSSAALPWQTVLSDARGPAVASQALAGFDAVEWASQGLTGPEDALAGVFDALDCPTPLMSAFDGLGEVWQLEAMAFKLTPGASAIQVPVEAVHEILRRHVKAADKRLRADQIERIDLKVSAPAWAADRLSQEGAGLSHSIARSVAALAVSHEVGALWSVPGFQDTHREALDALAERVTVSHYWPSTVRWVEHLSAARPLFDRLSLSEARCALGSLRRHHGALPPPADLREVVQSAKARPDQLLRALRGEATRWTPSQWRFGQAVEVKLYTTRGGWWPERRQSPDGSNCFAFDKVTNRVMEKFARGDAARASRGQEALKLDRAAPAEALIELLK